LGFQTIIRGILSGFSSSNLVLYRLWERDHYYSAFAEYNEILESYQSGGVPHQAREMAKQEYAKRKWEKFGGGRASARSREQIFAAVNPILQRGARWTALVNATQSEEVLLVNEDRPLMDATTTIGKVIASGTDEEFEVMKKFLLSEENNFKECCLRLTGVRRMIINLSDTPKKDKELRGYLIKAVEERIKNIFGSAGLADDNPLDEKNEIKFDPLQLAIWQLFGIDINFENGPLPPDFRPRTVPTGSYSSRHHPSY
jgi:hypothetical protein